MMEFKKKFPKTIEISASSNGGYIVECGCATLTYENSTKLLNDLADFLDDPAGIAEKYNKSINFDENPRNLGPSISSSS